MCDRLAWVAAQPGIDLWALDPNPVLYLLITTCATTVTCGIWNPAPPSQRRKAATDNMLCIFEDHPNWPVHADVFDHPPTRLASRRPIWSDMTSVDTVTQWREDWSSASVVSHTIVTNPTIRQPGFDLPPHTWSLLNHFQMGQGPCHANLHKWVSPNHLLTIVASDRPWTTLSTCDKIWRQTESIAQSGWWRSHMAGIYSDCSTRKMNEIGHRNPILQMCRCQFQLG